MLKLRLKKNGRKRNHSFRLVIMESTTRRNGRPIDEVGYYNPVTKQSYLDTVKITKWLKCGAQPTSRVLYLLKVVNLIAKSKVNY